MRILILSSFLLFSGSVSQAQHDPPLDSIVEIEISDIPIDTTGFLSTARAPHSRSERELAHQRYLSITRNTFIVPHYLDPEVERQVRSLALPQLDTTKRTARHKIDSSARSHSNQDILSLLVTNCEGILTGVPDTTIIDTLQRFTMSSGRILLGHYENAGANNAFAARSGGLSTHCDIQRSRAGNGTARFQCAGDARLAPLA